jgi:DNA-directed RNA polymerase specialized sigma24 family protein
MARRIVRRAFACAWKRIETFDPCRERLFGWLKALSREVACHLPHQVWAREEIQLHPLDRQSIERLASEELPEHELHRAGVKALALEALMELSSHYRQALVMNYVERRHLADMAAGLGLSRAAVKALLIRSRLAFKERLNERLVEVSWQVRRSAVPAYPPQYGGRCFGLCRCTTPRGSGDDFLNGPRRAVWRAVNQPLASFQYEK